MFRAKVLALLAALCLPPALGVSAPLRHSNGVALTAKAMGCDAATVRAVKALDLGCSLSWVLMRLCALSGAKPSELIGDRATRSWGEVCALHGQDWAALARDVTRRERAFGLVIEPNSQAQVLRSSSNRPDQMGLPAGRP